MKKGFTLVELLAVIVILAIILAIAVPGISSIIDNATKNSFMDDAKLVIKAINYKLMNDSSFDVTTIDETNANSILGISASNYSDLIVTKNNDDIRVVITGQAKWAGLVTYGTYTDMKVDDMPTGLVGYWNLDGNANDSSGNGNNGTVYGATLTTDNKGRANSAYSFDGTDDYIGIPYSSVVAPTSQISYGGWVYKSDWSTPFSGSTRMVSKTETGGYAISTGYASLGTFECLVYRNGAYGFAQASYTSLTNGWHHILCTYDGRYIKLYIDSVLKNTNDAGNNYNIAYAYTNRFLIGAEASSTISSPPDGSYLPGSIDDIRVYNRSLSSDEIGLIYNITK